MTDLPHRTRDVSFHVEQIDGLNHLAWCEWDHADLYLNQGIHLISAGKVSTSDAIKPLLYKVLEDINPQNVYYLKADPWTNSLAHPLHGSDMYPYSWIGDDETLMAEGKDAISLQCFKIPESMRFSPDFILDEGFNHCILSEDAVNHGDTTLLLSKAAAIGAISIVKAGGGYEVC